MSEGSRQTTAVLDRPRPKRTFKGRVRSFRAWVRRSPRRNFVWRTGIGTLGTIVVIVGIILIPYPGPGWLIVFTGLGILSTEFAWAGRLLRWARGHYDRWMAWVTAQSLVVKVALGLMTCAIVVATLWLLDGFWLMARIIGWGDWTWLQSPIWS